MKFFSNILNLIGVLIIVSLSIMAIFISLFIKDLGDNHALKKPFLYLTSFENRFYDYRMKPLIKYNEENDNIVLVKIDDESLQAINSWPIPRDNWAKLLLNLKEYGAKVVAFDVLFPEPVMSCGETSPDDNFAEAVASFQEKEGNSVILSYTVQDVLHGYIDESLMEEPPFEIYTSLLTGNVSPHCKDLKEKKIEVHNWPIQKLLDAEAELGYLNMAEDSDGVFRHYTVFANIESKEMEGYIMAPSLGLKAFMSGTTQKNLNMVVNNQCEGNMDINDLTLTTSKFAETKIRWVGGQSKFKDISLYRVLNGENFEEEVEYYEGNDYIKEKRFYDLTKFFKDKIVFIGSTATGAHDLRNTPIDPKLPGVYAHMNMVNMLQKQYFFKSIDDSVTYSIYFLAIGMIILILTMILNKPILDALVLAGILSLTYYIDHKYFIPDGYELKLFYCYFSYIATYSWVTFLNFNKSNAEKKQIKGAFSRYVAPSIVDDMLDNPDKLKVGGEKRDITCMFSDVRDFTSISEALSPTDLAAALNRYMGEMTDIVFETNGTLDKYIGDAIVAFWGAPIDIGDHVNQAVDAAVKSLEALPAINEEFKAKGFPEFKIGLGLNSGECSVGNMGSDQIFAYTALGDNMNLGARLESLCKYYGAQILISEYTYDRLDHERFTCRLIDNVIVKGKTEPVGVYEVLYSYHPFMIDQQGLKKFKEAFQSFTEGKFEEALIKFKELVESHPDDKASNRMKDTCEHWIENPPKEGENFLVTTMKTKG